MLRSITSAPVGKQSPANTLASSPFRLIAKSKSFINLVSKGDGNFPLYFIHDILGGCGHCEQLATELGDRQTFYKLEINKNYLKRLSSASLSEIAAIYIEEIAKTNPTGPIIVAGYSAGAVISFEIAQRLHAVGSMHYLVVIDGAPRSAQRGITEIASLTSSIRVFTLWLKIQLSECRNSSSIKRKLAKRCGRLFRQNHLSTHYGSYSNYSLVEELLSRPMPDYLKLFAENLYKELCSYQPVNYLGRIIVFESRVRRPIWRKGIVENWRKICERVQGVLIEGRHCDVWNTNNISIMAKNLRCTLYSSEV